MSLLKSLEKAAKVISGVDLAKSLWDTINPDMPEPEEPKVAPQLTDKQRRNAARRKYAMRSGGRESTMISEKSTLG